MTILLAVLASFTALVLTRACSRDSRPAQRPSGVLRVINRRQNRRGRRLARFLNINRTLQ